MTSELTISEKKSELRKKLKEKLKQLTADVYQKKQSEANISINLRTTIESNLRIKTKLSSVASSSGNQSTAVIGAFHPLHSEPNVLSTLENYSVSFSKVVGENLVFFKPKDSIQNSEWVKNSLGVFELTEGDVVSPADIDVVLVPGLAFDSKGQRLGRGRGFYDRYLKEFKNLKVGVCFDCQWQNEALPADEWDINMDWIVTESRVHKVKEL